MNKILRNLLAATSFCAVASAAEAQNITIKDSAGATQTMCTVVVSSANLPCTYAALSPTITNPTSTLTLTATTTAYSANQLIASSATAGSVVVPSFNIANSGGGASIPRVRLTTNDATATAWGGVQVEVDLWSAAPTFTNGDRGAFSPATGTASHLGTYICTMSAEYGDGAYAECAISPGGALIKLASGASIFWTLQALSASGVTGASKVFTLTAEVGN